VGELPLAGLKVVVTRPDPQSQGLVAGLEALGAVVASVPLVAIAPVDDPAALDAAAGALPIYDWVVFTSANGVRAFGERLSARERTPRVGVVGPPTAEAARELGVEPAFVGRGAAESLAEGLELTDGARVLLLQADLAGPELATALRQRGATVDALTAYRTVSRGPTHTGRASLDEADAIVLASGSAARSLAGTGWTGDALVACIGPKTASVAREVGLRVGLVADETSADGIIRALVEHFVEST
jgi:uroporphyrinogen-III synthase